MKDLTGEAQDINKMLSHHDFDGGSVRVSENGIVTICVNGLCIVRDLKGWHQLAIFADEVKGLKPLPEEVTRITEVVGADGRGVSAPCAIEGCQYSAHHAHAVMWRKHVQMMRRNLPPQEVDRMIHAVQQQVATDGCLPQHGEGSNGKA